MFINFQQKLKFYRFVLTDVVKVRCMENYQSECETDENLKNVFVSVDVDGVDNEFFFDALKFCNRLKIPLNL